MKAGGHYRSVFHHQQPPQYHRKHGRPVSFLRSKRHPHLCLHHAHGGTVGALFHGGLVTLTHAEALFGIALTQLVNPGITVVHAGLPSIANIAKNYAVDLGLKSHNIANLLQEKVNKMLDIPSIQTACTTSQDRPNEEAEKEAEYGFGLMKKYGFHQMRHSFGFLRELISFSIDKLERISRCARRPDLKATGYGALPYDRRIEAIRRNGSSANYMRDDHTLKNTGKEFLC